MLLGAITHDSNTAPVSASIRACHKIIINSFGIDGSAVSAAAAVFALRDIDPP